MSNSLQVSCSFIIKYLLIVFMILTNCLLLEASEYHIGTFNIDVDQKTWPNRVNMASNIILFNDFDIIGTQEVLSNQYNNLKQLLKEVYSSVGIGADDGKNKGEHCPIFYKTKIFKLLSSGTFWLSETPDKPSKSWDSSLNRICTYVKLKDLRDNSEIWLFNTHFDHKGIKAREESCKILLNKILQLSSKNSNIIITGDLNFNPGSQLNNSDFLKDTYLFAKYKWVPTGTFYGNKIDSIRLSRIDHVFVSKSANVIRYGILNNYYFTVDEKAVIDFGNIKENDIKNKTIKMMSASDHFPVSVFVEFKNSQLIDNNQIKSIKKNILKNLFK